MNLRVKDRKRLDTILGQLKRGQSFLLKESTLVCIRRSCATTTLDFANKQGEICVSVDKHIGSDLAQLHCGISELEKLLQLDD